MIQVCLSFPIRRDATQSLPQFMESVETDSPLNIVSNGEVIEDYSADRPTPTVLMFGWDKKRPIHVVLSLEPDGEVAVITAHAPSLDIFESDYRTRRKP